MKIPFAQIDAFAARPFEGNQACVMPLAQFLADDVLQAIAAENNVAETAFIVPDGDGSWALRWFTPTVEVPLCGHATLASGHYLYTHGGFAGDEITFVTRQSGELYVSRLSDGRLEMDFPAAKVHPIEIDEAISAAMGATPVEAWGGPTYCAVFESPDVVKNLAPDLGALAALGLADSVWGLGNFGCLALGGEGVDATSRFFAPGSGIPEDPATGSWHTMIAPILAAKTSKTAFECYQAYPGRGAYVGCELVDDRVKLRGSSVTVIEGTFQL
ncbi:MAG: PhzF family phenazine biosynthesis protein [Henriciella sp.]|nr:PhzF family phenazine biosynthesis protein [Henriciella sp.]